jgi:surface protein
MKKLLLLIFGLILSSQTIKAQVVLDANGVTIKWTGTTVPSPYFVQASPRGTLEWFAIVSDATKIKISNYAGNSQTGITYFTRPGSSTPIPFNNIVTSLVTDMQGMFDGASTFNQNIGSWDVSNVLSMYNMFPNASAFNQPIGFWNVSNVTNMRNMFSQATSFNQNIGTWNVSNVTDMRFMFRQAISFNQNISSWNVSNVTHMRLMFTQAIEFDQNISSWNVSNVISMENMFLDAGLSSANYDTLLIGWSTIIFPETPLKTGVAFDAGSSKYCKGTSARDSIISKYGWTITDGGFDCTIPNQIILDSNGVTIKWTGKKVPSPYFVQASPRGTPEWFAVVSDDTKSNITYYAKNIQLGRNFFTPPGSSTPIPFNNIVTSLVTNMDGMFTSTLFFNHPLGSWDVSNVTSMAQMFSYTNSFNQPIGFWNVNKVTNMNGMFSNATSFNQSIEYWNVSNVSDMNSMFYQATSFNQPIGSWDVSKVTSMAQMFSLTNSFNQPIGSWNVSKVTYMGNMFFNALAFNQPLGSWNISNVTNMSYMFSGNSLSKANYDSLLIGWSTIIFPETPLKTFVPFSAGNSKYCKGDSARASIINTYGWNITDGGFDCSLPNQIFLDKNGVTVKWSSPTIPSSPYFVQASPRGTLEWFAVIDTSINIIDYAKNIQSGRNFFTPPGESNPVLFNNIVTSLVKNMDSMFYNANSFNQPIDSWDVSKVIFMRYMFSGATAFDQNIGSWNISNVISFYNMFLDAGLSTSNYDSLLIGWSTIIFPETPLITGIPFSAGNSKYCKGASARSTIINSYGWSITDGGFDCTISGVEELEESKLKLYPNPVESILNVAIDYHLIDEPYVIIDGLGKVVLKGIFKEVESAINLKELSKGIYYLRVSDSYSSKFIKE